MKLLYLLEQIFKISSVFCLIVASFERFRITRHWTFTGFGVRTRWIILFFILFFAVVFKIFTVSVSFLTTIFYICIHI
ncbi:unnamed protein product [Dracunculus medinensis]|uniref:Uncharacterized protein n=1 Tax=Dracunculus medinensis TaxID=318479 RepID=A0A0N4U9F2_DRAME|nr:unnamed protein product [Dracunculus medinensis]